MKSSSNVEPALIEPDMGTLKTDTIDILIHWGISTVTKTDMGGNTYTIYEYEEERLNRPLPAGVRSLEDITAYFTARYDRLLILAGAETIPERITATEDLLAAIVEGAI